MHRRIWAFVLFVLFVGTLALVIIRMRVHGQSLGPTQNIVLDSTTVLNASPLRPGYNQYGFAPFGAAQQSKDLLGAVNSYFQPETIYSLYSVSAGSTTTFTSPYTDNVDANRMIGAAIQVQALAAGGTGGSLGCHGIVSANTLGNSSTNPVYTFVADYMEDPTTGAHTAISGGACPVAIAAGDQVAVQFIEKPTPTWLSQTKNGISYNMLGVGGNCTVSNGGVIRTNTTSPYSGSQDIILDTTAASNATATCNFTIDQTSTDDSYIRINTTMRQSAMVKSVTGNTTGIYFQTKRNGSFACGGVQNGGAAPSSSAFVALPTDCGISESNTSASQPIQSQINLLGQGAVEIGAMSFAPAPGFGNSANDTFLRDEVLAGYQNSCGSLSGGPLCTIRTWFGIMGMPAHDWVSLANHGCYYSGPPTVYNCTQIPALPEILHAIKRIGGIPYMMQPLMWFTSDEIFYTEYMTGTNHSLPGVIARDANCTAKPTLVICPGGTTTSIPWVGPTGVFPVAYSTRGNEPWNSTFGSQNVPYRTTSNGILGPLAYLNGPHNAAMRASSAYNAALLLGDAFQGGTVTPAIATPYYAYLASVGGYSDYAEYGRYGQYKFSGNTPDWQTAFSYPWADTRPSGFANADTPAYVASTHTFGPGGANVGQNMVYEYGGGASTFTSPITQASIDQSTKGGARGIITAWQSLEMMKTQHFTGMNYFAPTASYSQSIGGYHPLIWGGWTDCGGAQSVTNGVNCQETPDMIALRTLASSIIGPMVSATITSPPTYNQAANSNNGPVGAISNVPYLSPYFFKDSGNNRAIVLINSDVTNNFSYPVTFSRPDAPVGTVTVIQVAPPTNGSMNQLGFGSYTGLFASTVTQTTATMSASSIPPVQPGSMMVIKYSTTSTAPAASFSPTSLSYTTTVGTAPATKTATLSNTGTGTLTISSIALGGSNPSAFSITANACGSTLAAGSSCAVTVGLTNTTLGTYSASLIATDNASPTTQTVALSATVTAVPVPTAVLAPSSLTFTALAGNSSAAQNLTLSNTGAAPLAISSIVVSGTNASLFSQTNGCGSTLAAGADCAIAVIFSPTAAGSFSASVVVTDNSGGSNSTQSSALSGTATAPTLPAASLTPSTLSFTAVQGNMAPPQTATLTNTGSVPLTTSFIGITAPSLFNIVSNSCPFTLASGQNCTVTVGLSTSALGVYSGTLNVSTNASPSVPAVILAGTITTTPPTPKITFSSTTVPASGSMTFFFTSTVPIYAGVEIYYACSPGKLPASVNDMTQYVTNASITLTGFRSGTCYRALLRGYTQSGAFISTPYNFSTP